MDGRSFNTTSDKLASPARSTQERRDLVFKFLIIGDYGVGKTAIVRRYTEGKFSSNYKITIGADFCVRSMMWDAKTRVSLQLWDIAGHERFSYMTRVYYKYAVGCAVVFDVTRHASFKSVTRWVNDLNNKVMLEDGSQVPIILLANKWDIGESCVTDEAINKLCKELGIPTWFKTSAKYNLNIDEGISKLVEEAIKLTKGNEPPVKKSEGVVLAERRPTNGSLWDRDGCCN
uniref:Ras-related protein Rab-32B n=1 Tax=Lygus hesperus TaxID=30085 RepID=A0A146LPA0_LYGHE